MENIHFSEFAPSVALAPYVQTYWSGNFNITGGDNFSQSVLPNGCLELIIHSKDEHCSLSKSENSWCGPPEFVLLRLYEKRIAPTELLATYENATYVAGNN